jgi:uncharacterized protein with NAD-binding domain and iron-sulfur cluster
MARRKIAILGGGIGSLTAAYYLTRTPELRAQNDVTIYQLGWRLGGKCASGRSQIEGQGLRSEEHGLHLWFGFYENAFATLQEVYARRLTRPDDALVTWRDAFEPNSFTPIGEEYNGQLGYWPFVWAQNLDVPGDGRLELTPLGALSQLASILRSLAGDLWSQVDANAESFSERVRGLFEQAGLAFGLAPLLVGLEAIEALGSAGISALADHHRGFDTVSHKLREIFQSLAHKHLADPDFRRVYCLFDLGITTLLGLLNPRYGVFEDADFDLDRIDYLDYRAWLLENGGDPWVVNECSYLRALYDLPFAYEDGDVKKPAMGAGTSIRILMRIIFTYKEACFFQMKAGMGEAVIAPYYEVLRAQGVKVEFFRKVRKLELSPDKRWVQRVHLERQVDLAGEAYEPTFRVEGLSCWPSEPFWDQIRDGEALRRELEAKKTTLESHWCLHKTGDEVLELGTDFDEVVLGIALGAFKKLNDEPTMCDELYEHSPRFRAMAEGLGLVPTQSFQLWTDPDLAGLGWAALRQRPPAMDAAP